MNKKIGFIAALGAAVLLTAGAAEARGGVSSGGSHASFSSARSYSYSTPKSYSFSSSPRYNSTVSRPIAPAPVVVNRTINRTTVVHQGGSDMGFFHGMLIGQMLNHPQPVVYAGGGGVTMATPGYVQTSFNWGGFIIGLLIVLAVILGLVWLINNAKRDY